MADCNRNCCNDCGRERKYPCDTNFREAVCVHTDKIYDSCRDKDCLENVRVYLTSCGQDIVDRAINVKCTKAEVIWVFTDIEAVPFNRGFYSVDLKYFFKVTLAVFTGVGRPTEVEGLATFDKKVILFGSEGNAKVFESKYKEDAFDPQLWRKTNMPHAVVEVADCKMAGKNTKDITVKQCVYTVEKRYNGTCGINLKNGLNEKFKPFFILWNILTTVVENDIIFLIIII